MGFAGKTQRNILHTFGGAASSVLRKVHENPDHIFSVFSSKPRLVQRFSVAVKIFNQILER